MIKTWFFGRFTAGLKIGSTLILIPKHFCLISSSKVLFLAVRTNLAPSFAASIAQLAPIPVEAPLIQRTCPFKSSKKKSLKNFLSRFWPKSYGFACQIWRGTIGPSRHLGKKVGDRKWQSTKPVKWSKIPKMTLLFFGNSAVATARSSVYKCYRVSLYLHGDTGCVNKALLFSKF